MNAVGKNYIEAMRAIETLAPEKWDHPSVKPNLLQLMNAAVSFRFDDVYPDKHHFDFALDLAAKGLFKLPYPVVAYEFGNQIVVAAMDGQSIGLICFLRIPNAQLQCPIFRVLLDRVPGEVGPMEFEVEYLVDEKGKEILGWGRDRVGQIVKDDLAMTMAFTVVLMTKGCALETKNPPRRINEKRLKSGRPMIPVVHTVKIEAGQLYSASFVEPTDDGIKRTPPRIHWRRGHFRVLNRGTDYEVEVPVAPCIVGAGDDVDVPRPAYFVNPGPDPAAIKS